MHLPYPEARCRCRYLADGEELHSMSVKLRQKNGSCGTTLATITTLPLPYGSRGDGTIRTHKKALERDNAKDYRIVEEALKTVQMDAFADRTFSTLSVESSRGYSGKSTCTDTTDPWWADQPSGYHTSDHADGTGKKLNVTVISAIHDLNIAAAYCDKIYVLKDGKGRIWNSTGSTHSGADQRIYRVDSGSGKMTAAGRCIFYFYNIRIDRPGVRKILTLAWYIWRKDEEDRNFNNRSRIPHLGDGMNCTFEHVCSNS